MLCPYCKNSSFYNLKDGRKKCKKCGRKFSAKKIALQLDIISTFCDNKNALECAKELDISYITAKKYFMDFREKIAFYLENYFKNQEVIEYDEYIYLEKSKKREKSNIFDAEDFLTFHYEKGIYNILLENIGKFKNQFLTDGIDEAYYKEFSNYMMFNKISKLQKRDNLIVKFWNFFENEIVKYKGIKRENFFYYLKEFEFKFNFQEKEQKKILQELILHQA